MKLQFTKQQRSKINFRGAGFFTGLAFIISIYANLGTTVTIKDCIIMTALFPTMWVVVYRVQQFIDYHNHPDLI